MAKWWELVIPAASALGGVAITGGLALLGSSRQRRHETALRLLDDKGRAYARMGPALNALQDGRRQQLAIDGRTSEGVRARLQEETEAARTAIQEVSNIVHFVGSREVRRAMWNLMNAAVDKPDLSSEERTRLEHDFGVAARRDLGVVDG